MEIDSLEIQIESEAKSTFSALNTLKDKLEDIADVLNLIGENKGLSNFCKSVKEATKDISGVQGKLKGVSSGIDSQTKEISKGLEEITAQFQKNLQKLEVPKVREKNIDKLSKSLEKAEAKADGLRIKLKNSLNLGDITESIDDSGFRRLQKQIVLAEKEADALRTKIAEVKKASPGSATKGIESIGKSLKDVTLSAEQFGEYLKNLKIPEIRETNLKKLQSELDRTEKKLDELKTKSDNWTAKGINPDSTKFRNLQEQIIATSKKLDALKDKIKEVEKASNSLSTVVISPKVDTSLLPTVISPKIDTSAFDKTKDISKNFKNIRKIMENIGQTSSWERIQTAADALSKVFEGLKKGVKGTSNAIKKLGTGFSGLYAVIKKLTSAVGILFSNMTRLAAKAASAMVSSVKGISNAFNKISGSGSGLKSASSGLGKIVKAAGGLLAVGGLASFGKSAVELGSDITEVENVVETAFGSMANKAYDFASTAAEQFGLSELAAKQYSGTMMAILKSSGIAQDAAADMAINLAGLAGDMASFYNLDTDEAFNKLRAGISGESEPLKQLGINMNIVNLEAFAMSQGIRKAYNEMTLAEQTALRYNFIMAKSKDAHKDFADTAGTFANQLRLLRLNIQSISAVIGQGLIAAILPAIKFLNKFMEKVMQAAKVFRDFMYVLTGNKIEGSAKGIVDSMVDTTDYTVDLSGIGDSADDMADGFENAASGASALTADTKKLQKQLGQLSFDELNQLPAKLDDLGDLGTSGKTKDKNLGLDDLGLGGIDDMFDDLYEKSSIEPVNKWAEAIRKAFLDKDWEGLGKAIAEMMNAGLEKVYKTIKDITPKVEQALRNFAEVFNSWVKYFNWDLLGRTIGAGINLLAKSFNALFDPKGGINLEELGKGLSKSFRGMIKEIKWRELGNALGNAFMIPWRIASGVVEDMWRIDEETLLTGWAETGIALADAVHGIFEKINFVQIGKTLTDGFNGIVEVIRNFRNQMASNRTWSMIAMNISDGLNYVIDNIDLAGMAHQLSGLALDILNMLNDAAERTHWEDFGYKVAEALFSIPWLQLFNQVFDLVSATFGRAIGGFVNYLTTHAEQLGLGFAAFFNNVFDKIKYITDSIPWDDIGLAISTFLNTSIGEIKPVEAAQNLGNFVTSLLGTMKQVAQETNWRELGELIGDFLINIPWGTIIGQAFDIITSVFGGLITGLGGKILGKMPEVGTALATGFNNAFGRLKQFVDSMDGRWTEIGHTIATSLNNMIRKIDWKTAGETFGKFVKGIIDTIFTVAQETDWVAFGRGIAEFLQGIPWLELLGKVFATLKTILDGLITGLKETTAGKVVAGLLTIWLKLKLFDLQGKVKSLVTKIGQAFGLLPKGITDTIPGIDKGIGRIAGQGGLFSKLASGLPAIVSKVGSLLGSIGSVIFSPQGLLIAGIIAGVAAIVLNWDKIKEAAGAVKDWVAEKWEGLKEKTSEIWGNVTTFLGDTWENLKESASTIFGSIKDSISEKFEGIREIASSVWETVSSGLGNIWGSLKTKAGDIWGAITGKVSDENSKSEQNTTTTWGNASERLRDSLSVMDASTATMMASMSGTVGSSMGEIANSYISQWQAIGGATHNVIQGVQTEITMMMQFIKTIVATSMQEVGAIFHSGWQSVVMISVAAIEQISANVMARMTAMQAIASTSMQQIAGIFASAWQAIGSMSLAATTRMQEDVTSKMRNMMNVVATSMKSITDIYSSGWKSAENITSSALSGMQSTASSKMNAIKSTVSTAMNSIQSTFKTKWTEIGNTVTQALNNINSAITSKMNAAKNTVNTIMASIQNIFKTKWDSISNACKQALDKMQSTVSSKMNAIKTTVSSAMSSITSIYRNELNKFPSIASNVLGNVVNVFRNLPNRISSALSGLYNTGRNAAQSFANGFKSVRIPVPHLRVESWTPHKSGETTYSTPNYEVNWYKDGGLFYNPSIIGVGEAGRETVLPLDNKRTMGMIADSIMNNYSGGIDEDMLAKAVEQGVVTALMNNWHNLTSNNKMPEYLQNNIYIDGDVMARAVSKANYERDYRMNPTPQFG